MHLKAILTKWLKLFVADIRQAIVSYIVVGLILAGGGVVLLTKIGLNCAIQLANIHTPLWATILLILLCVLYIHLKVKRTQTKKDPSNSPPNTTLNSETQKPQSQPPPLPQLPTRLPPLQEKLLLHLFNHKHKERPYTIHIAQALAIPEDEIKYNLEELRKNEYVRPLNPPVSGLPGQQSWSIEHKGEKYLRKNNLIPQQGVQPDAE